MRLSMDVPGAMHANIFLNGDKLECCFAADDALGIALVGVFQKGRLIPAPLHRDWKPEEFEHQGVVVRWLRGAVTFAFEPAEKRALAEQYWQHFIAHTALWTLGEFVSKGPR
jgi:hypothetical protein